MSLARALLVWLLTFTAGCLLIGSIVLVLKHYLPAAHPPLTALGALVLGGWGIAMLRYAGTLFFNDEPTGEEKHTAEAYDNTSHATQAEVT